jgi:cytoskeletal protein RodZ
MTTIGETLKQSRLDRNLTIKSASEATAIRARYLEALESDDFDSLPSPVQAKGFLRIYADYLGLDSKALLADLRGDSPPVESLPADLTGQTVPALEEPGLAEARQDEIQTPPAGENDPSPEKIDFEEPPPPDFDETEPELQSPYPDLPLPLSKSIFLEIGQQLRSRRDLLSLTLVEIERHTHIRKYHLAALESGEVDNLPSSVQARGILSSYARFLDLDADSLLLRFAEGLQASRLERHPRHSTKRRDNDEGAVLPSAFRRLISMDLILGGGMILIMIAFAVWGANQIISQRELAQTDLDSGQSISEALLAETLATEEAIVPATSSPDIIIASGNQIETPTAIEIPTLGRTSPVQVVTALLGTTWMRIKVDGTIEFQGRAAAGSAYTFSGKEKIEVLAANGSLVQIYYNGEDLGLMGDSGAISEIIYTPQGTLLPTPTSTPTPTRTPRVTPTYTPSITPTTTDKPEPSG